MSRMSQYFYDLTHDLAEPFEIICEGYMTREEAEEKFDSGDLSDEYAEYIMNNCHGERIIGNGDALIIAMEQGYLLDSFIESIVDHRE